MTTDSASLNSQEQGVEAPDEASASSAAEESFADDGVLYAEEVTPEQGILGFTLRELLIVGAWFVLFVVSFFPLGWSTTLWAQGIMWLLPVGVPTVAVFLLVLRRFSPDGIRRVGSLGIDQFASVAFSVAAVWWVQQLWAYVIVLLTSGHDSIVWVPWVQLAISVVLVGLTVFAPLIPGLKDDFRGRLVTLAHRNANPVRPVVARPKSEIAQPPVYQELPPQAMAPTTDALGGVDLAGVSGVIATDEIAPADYAGQVPLTSHASGGDTGTTRVVSDEEYVPHYSRRSRGSDAEIASDTGSIEALMETSVLPLDDATPAAESRVAEEAQDLDVTNPRDAAVSAQPFWILAATDRDVHDERGNPLFRIGPTAWALVVEDRGGAYVVRHDDGRIGYLHDIADITKG